MRRLSARLLLFNLMLLFFPLGSLLYLDTYEKQLLSTQENSMIQQGRIFSSALSGRNLAADAQNILERLEGRVDSRIRIIHRDGRLLADSAALMQEKSPIPSRVRNASESVLYRTAVYPLNLFKRIFFPPQSVYDTGEYYSGKTILLGQEIQAALAGRYGAVTRYSTGGQISVNLYSAIPVFGETPDEVLGVVLVSRSTYSILMNLYELRLDIIRIFLFSLAAALVLSLVLSLTITRPIGKLKREAERVLDKSGRFRAHFTGLKRKDEIGDLSRSLSELSGRLEKRITFIDGFTADLFHELKNPLAAIRGAVEMSLSSPEREEKFLEGILAEEKRMERLLSRLREISRIDSLLDREPVEALDLTQLIPVILSRYPHKDYPSVKVEFINRVPAGAGVRVNSDRLVQLLTNPVDNALSFSPRNSVVEVCLEEGADQGVPGFRITVDDSGPGIQEASLPRVFDRFYSDRANSRDGVHSGLGLAIVQTIVLGYGGSCSLENRDHRGCRLTLFLPGPAGSHGAGAQAETQIKRFGHGKADFPGDKHDQ